MTPTPSLSARLKREAQALGFDLVGIAPVRESDHGAFYREWLQAARHGAMSYLARPEAVERRLDPRAAWPEVRSALVVAHNYYEEGDEGAAADPARGIVARYARGRDYHRVIRKKLLELVRFLEGEVGRELPAARAYVDTGPVLERELARRAGLGWFGRNTMLIHPQRGSYFFLGTLLLELELDYDSPFEPDRCGTCSACTDACPTGALLGRDQNGAPVIDATRCISYLTIENRGPIPRELRPLIGNRVFGCDICQEICPFNARFARESAEPGYAARGPRERPRGVQPVGGRPARVASGPLGVGEHGLGMQPERGSAGNNLPEDWHPGTDSPSLIDLMSMDEAAWDAFSRGSAIRRATRAGFLRNVAVALGNWGEAEAVPALVAALGDDEPLVRAHAAWALGEIAAPESLPALGASWSSEADPFVLSELDAAFAKLRPNVK